MNLSFARKKISASLIWWILAIIVNLALALVLVKYFFTIEQANLITSAALSSQNITGWPMAVHQTATSKKAIAIDYNEASTLQPILEASLVKFFLNKDKVTSTVVQLGDLYNLDKPAASGWVVTSDGWLVSSADLTDWSVLVAVTNNHKVHKIDQKTTDPLTGLFFYHLTGVSNLTPVKLGEVGWSRPGQLMYGLDSRGGLKSAWLERTTEDNVVAVNSDSLLRRWQFSSLWADSAIFNGQGDLFSLVDHQGRLVPANYIKSGLNSLSDSGNFKRVSFGLIYNDLNSLSTDRIGLLVSQVIAGSPAAKAGIKPGDILLNFDSINLNGEIALNEILQSYKFGDRVGLIIQRAGQNRQLNCQF